MVKRLILRICDFIFVMRPLILIPAWSFYLLGVALARRNGSGEFGAGLGCLTAILACAYLINQLFDQETDRYNDKCRYIADGIFKPRTIVAMAFLCFIVASALFREVAAPQRFPLVAALVLALVYSLPPLRLCARPFADLAANAVGYGGIAVVAGIGACAPVGLDAWFASTPYVCLVGATFLHTTVLDVKGDRAAGKITTTVAIGVPASLSLAVGLSLAAFLVAWAGPFRLFGDIVAPILTGVMLPVFAVGAAQARRKRGEADGTAANRVSSYCIQAATAAVAVAAALFWPAYLAVVVPLLVLSRFYYRARFNVAYPGPAQSASGAG